MATDLTAALTAAGTVWDPAGTGPPGAVAIKAQLQINGDHQLPTGDSDRVVDVPTAAAGSTPAIGGAPPGMGTSRSPDRVKDIVISGGENVSTIEVENALMSHPAVADVAVIAVSDQRWGERLKRSWCWAPGSTRNRPNRSPPRQGADREVQGTQGGRLRPRSARDVDR